MKKICLILQSYDEKKYYQMCCEDHYKQFDPDIVGKIDLMQPSMNRKLSDLKGIISLIIDSQLAENAVILLDCHSFSRKTTLLTPEYINAKSPISTKVLGKSTVTGESVNS